MRIVLATLNARYTHASFGLRYLRANLGAHREDSVIKEFTIKRPVPEIVAEILAEEPLLVGFGIYIWNTDQTLAVVKLLRELRPELVIVAGGPEITFETESQEIFPLLDHVFRGEADLTFRDFVAEFFAGRETRSEARAVTPKIIGPHLPDIKAIVSPYTEYSDEDIQHRTLYVEASRGCPYKCEYCLSSLDVSVRNFAIEPFLTDLDLLIQRGARQFKFVDRTFNLSPTISCKILQFFLDRIQLGLFLHFEMVPDRLPDNLRALIEQFPEGALQFEIGIQTWNPLVARNVSRRQDYEKICENLNYLRDQTKVHSHADLIVGLPGETLASFGEGLDALFRLRPDEVQIGILKRLKGAPISRHDDKFQMKYSLRSPFQILQNKDLSAEEVQRMEVFAAFWDQVVNSGRFPEFAVFLFEVTSVFQFFSQIAARLHVRFQRTHSIHLRDLGPALREALRAESFSDEQALDLAPDLVEVTGRARVPASRASSFRQQEHLRSRQKH